MAEPAGTAPPVASQAREAQSGSGGAAAAGEHAAAAGADVASQAREAQSGSGGAAAAGEHAAAAAERASPERPSPHRSALEEGIEMSHLDPHVRRALHGLAAKHPEVELALQNCGEAPLAIKANEQFVADVVGRIAKLFTVMQVQAKSPRAS